MDCALFVPPAFVVYCTVTFLSFFISLKGADMTYLSALSKLISLLFSLLSSWVYFYNHR
jgi:hypothetical protein